MFGLVQIYYARCIILLFTSFSHIAFCEADFIAFCILRFVSSLLLDGSVQELFSIIFAHLVPIVLILLIVLILVVLVFVVLCSCLYSRSLF